MQGHVRRVIGLAAVLVLATMAAGCGDRPQALVRHTEGGVDETVNYNLATYQLAKDHKVQIVLFRRAAAPIGQADPDFEYVFLEIPDGGQYGWLKEDNVPAWRWLHEDGRDRIWTATAGQVKLRIAGYVRHVHLDFKATMEPIAETSGGPYIFSGKILCAEDMVVTQNEINRYGHWLRSILSRKMPPTPGAK